MSIDRILDLFSPGFRVFVPGSSGEPSALLAAWAADPDRTAGLDIFTSLVPGINQLNPATLHPTAILSGIFAQPSLAAAQRKGSYRHIPLSYAGFVRDLARQPCFDITVIQFSPPDHEGRCSFGPSVELSTAAMAHSRMTIAVVNEQTPFFPGAPNISLDHVAGWAPCDVPLVTYDPGEPDPAAREIAHHIAKIVPDGAVIQIGIGKVPAALAEALINHRGLHVRTGMFGDGMRLLAESGALDASSPMQTTSVCGQEMLYKWAARQSHLKIVGCEHSHDLASLAATVGLHAINSALEVDLFGQCNLETVRGSAVSAAGGAPDFARAAKVAVGGLSIVALPATAGQKKASRIIPRLAAPGLATIPRHDVDLVVTENGIADLRMASVHERADALIAIAAPSFRAELIDHWAEIAKHL